MFWRLFSNKVRAQPIGAIDLVQVTVHSDILQVPPLPADASDAPTSWQETWGRPNSGSGEHVRDLRDPAAIDALLVFVNDRLSGWYDPWYGTPIATVRAYFWKEKSLAGTFGAGANFFSRGQFPAERIIGASTDELAHFHRLVHLSGITKRQHRK